MDKSARKIKVPPAKAGLYPVPKKQAGEPANFAMMRNPVEWSAKEE